MRRLFRDPTRECEKDRRHRALPTRESSATGPNFPFLETIHILKIQPCKVNQLACEILLFCISGNRKINANIKRFLKVSVVEFILQKRAANEICPIESAIELFLQIELFTS